MDIAYDEMQAAGATTLPDDVALDLPELPDDMWRVIIDHAGVDGKRARRLAKLGRVFGEAARQHEDNVVPACRYAVTLYSRNSVW